MIFKITVLAVVATGMVADAKDLCQAPDSAYPPPSDKEIQWETINLDLPPQDRWTHIVEPRKDQIKLMLEGTINELPAGIVKVLREAIAKLPNSLDSFPQDYGEELRGIAKATNISLGDIILYNVMYEVEGACTSIVAETAQGEILHARNLDFGLFFGWDKKNQTWILAERLRPLLFNAEFQKGGKTLYKTTAFAGFIGVLTGVKQGGFSITVDTRFDDNFDSGLINWFQGNHTAKFLTFSTRNLMETASTYSEALDTLATYDSVGPAYIIIGGVKSGEGAVVTKGKWGTVDVWTLEDRRKYNNSFFVLETNYDRWVSAPFFDDRREPATDCLNDLGSSAVSLPKLFNVLSGKPNLNRLTTYTTLMQPSTGHLEAYLQYCPAPCPFW